MQCCDRFLYYYILAVIPPHQPSPKTHYPSLCTMYLPPLLKGGGLTARHKLSLCCIFACDKSAFFIYQTFCRQDGGIALHHQPSPKTHYPSKSTIFLPFNERSVGFASMQSLWAFNFGHPCPPSKKGEVLLLGQAEPTMVGIVIAQKLFLDCFGSFPRQY